MVEGWAEHPGGRHHGAHRAAASRSLDVAERDLLDFSQNVNPLGVPAEAMEAARRALREDAGHYPDAGYRLLRDALAAYLGVSPAKILPTNGGAEALFLAARGARAELVLPLAGIAVAGYVLYHHVWPVPDFPYDVFPYLVAAWLGLGIALARRV